MSGNNSFKISKGYSESVNRRTDNAMAKRKGQKNKQRSTKHAHKTKDQVTQTPLKTGRTIDTQRVIIIYLIVYIRRKSYSNKARLRLG